MNDAEQAIRAARQVIDGRGRPRRLLSQLHPALYFTSVWLRRIRRFAGWRLDGRRYAAAQQAEKLPFRVFKHQSVLIRKLGETDMALQHNKVTNLRLAIPYIDGLLIRPGEVFSFCRRVGRPTVKRGFLYGIELSFGKARPGIGGGLCQITNLIHWLAMHSPLTVTERHHHSFDPFPDSGRVLPFGSGAAIFYNYLDYQLTNHTPHTFQLRLWLSEKCLDGELRCDADIGVKYTVFEKNHAFFRHNGRYYRTNEIWRSTVEKGHGGREIAKDLIAYNVAETGYTPSQVIAEEE